MRIRPVRRTKYDNAVLQISLSVSLFYSTLHFPLGFFFFDRFPLIIGFFAFRKPDQHFGFAPNEIDLERDEGKSFLRDLADQPADLFFMQKQFPGPKRLMVHDIAERIRAYGRIEKKHLVVLYNGVAVGKIRETLAQGFDLGALKRNARLEGLFNKIVVICFAVGRNSRIGLYFLSWSVPVRSGVDNDTHTEFKKQAVLVYTDSRRQM